MDVFWIIFLDNYVGDEGLSELSNNLKYTPNLSKLNIYRNEAGNNGLIDLSKNLKYIENLTLLDISSI